MNTEEKLHSEHEKLSRKQLLQLGLLFLAFCALLCFFSPNVRGSDQYWYVGDVERVVLQDGLFKSNSVFPESLPADINDLPRPWVQNKPATYLVLPFALITKSGHIAWLIFNAICLYAAAFFTGRVLRIANNKMLLFIAVFVFFPVNFYLASQALPEIFVLALVAAIHYLLLSGKISYPKIILLGVIVAFLTCQRSNYMLLLLIVPMIFYVISKKHVLQFIAVFILVTIATSTMNVLFGQHLLKTPSVISTIVNNVQGKSNMGNFFGNFDNPNAGISDLLPVLFQKFSGAMAEQFHLGGLPSVMFYLINIMLLCIPVLFFQKKLFTRIHLVCLAFLAVHFITIVLFYNQYRYAAAIVPSLFIMNVTLFRNLKIRFFQQSKFRYGVLAFAMLMSIGIGLQLRKQSFADRELVTEIKDTIREHHSDAVMCSWNNGSGLAVGYAASPKNTFYFIPQMPLSDWIAAARKIGANGAFLNPESELYKKLKPFAGKETALKNSNMVFLEIALRD